MQITEDEIIEKYAKNCGHCIRNVYYYTNLNGVVIHAGSA